MDTLETFRDIRGYQLNNFKRDKPSCFNGIVNIHRYKITVELIEEPQEVLENRLQELWDNSKNYHDYEPLQAMAKKIKYELKNKRGNK